MSRRTAVDPAPPWGVLLLMACMLTSSISADLDVANRLTNVSAVQGQTAELPCDVTAPVAGDQLRLVLWYHGTGGTPIYTYDARGRKSLRGSHWVDSTLDRTRVQFQPDSKPAHLRIRDVQGQDQRLYRCRVDFLHSPTRNSRVNLTVIVPPETPILYDGGGDMVVDRAGPFREGQTAVITCVARGGWPSPNVTWWSGNALLDRSWSAGPDGAVRNQLMVGPLSRADLGAQFTCWATNHVLSSPQSATFRIEMLLPPLDVSILGDNTARSVGVAYQITCQAAGSRPPALVSWWIGSHKLDTSRQVVLEDGNVTRAVLSWTPRLADVGQQLSCRAENRKMLLAPLQTSWMLDIRYKPQPSLRVWSSLQERRVRVGDDVFMKCDVRAQPPVTDIQWRFQSRPISQYTHLHPNIREDTLVLRQVAARAAGNYSCVARNAQGSTESRSVYLDIEVAPHCRSVNPVTLHVARGQTVNVTCRVSANPMPSRFSWTLNSTGLTTAVPADSVSSTGLLSVLAYTPRSVHDFGRLFCVATNSLGPQTQPCVFHLILSEEPGALRNCTTRNRTDAGVDVTCIPSFDGGHRQWFSVLVHDSHSLQLVVNRSSAIPRFYISELKKGHNYSISVWAENERGRGPSSRLQTTTTFTLASAAEHTRSLGSLFRMTPILGILIGIVGTLILLAVSIVVTMRMRGHNDAKEGYPAGTQLTKDSPNRPAHLDNNPDLIQVKIDDIDDPEERYMAERLINGAPRDGARKLQAMSPPPNSYTTLGHGEYTRVPSPKMGPYFTLPRDLAQRSCSSEASEGRYEPGQADCSTLEEAAPLMPAERDRRESVV